jgi:hypothetical protein
MRPGGVTMLSIETDRDCPARYANPDEYPTLIYHTVTIGIPGGGHVVIKHAFDVLCGLLTGKFAVAQPPQRNTHSPVTGARAALELPRGVVAGTTLDYVAALTNPTGTDMVLTLCRLPAGPWLGGEGNPLAQLPLAAAHPGAPDRALCDAAPHARRHADRPRHRVLAGRRPGRRLCPQIAAGLRTRHPMPAIPAPCSITGPGRIPGPPNLLGAKGMAIEVPLTVTNISGGPCSVDGCHP